MFNSAFARGFQDFFLGNILDFLSPAHCLVCENKIERNDDSIYFCQVCRDAAPAAPTRNELIERLRRNFPGENLYISNAYALYSHKENSEYMNLIYGLKYLNLRRLGLELGIMLGQKLKIAQTASYDGIIPTPLHHAKKRERGFNQSDWIASGVAKASGFPVKNNILQRKKYTATQTAMNAAQRKTNVGGVFSVKKSVKLNGGAYLLIDDVLTTGSTMNNCAETLLEAGALRVDAAAIATA